ncbi:MAG: HipA N-terminal domain-containing protein, partial [Planctomycetes bacterium]|nr:HipA N-terminal domain-containing protein [Planctomycetota bacterium]
MSQAVGPATRVEELDVFRGLHRLGRLARTAQGATFVYEPSYVACNLGDPDKCVSFAMPVRSAAYEVHGANLHSFFAGLLPEGLRFQSLVRGLGIASDDLFGLLAAVGGDTVGDIRALPRGFDCTAQDPLVDIHDLQRQVFSKLQIQSFEDGILADPVVMPGLQAKVSVGVVSHPLRSRSRRTESFLKIPPALFPRLAENE